MKAHRFGRSAALLSVAAIALTACSSADSGNGGSDASGSAGGEHASGSAGGEQGTTSEVQGNLVGAGASSQEAAMTAWTQGVTEIAPNLTVQYSPDGSGAGREKFLAGATSFAGSDAALKEEEAESAKKNCGDEGAFHVPAYISPIAVAYNLPGVDDVKMDAETIAKVFSGEIKNWNDEAIAAQNEGVELPDTPITVVHRSDDSGTTENFTAYLTEAAGDVDEELADDDDGPGGRGGCCRVAHATSSRPGSPAVRSRSWWLSMRRMVPERLRMTIEFVVARPRE